MTALSADRPREHPKEDRFGYAPFAENLAKSMCAYTGTDGLVLAIHGPWGSGKSTILNYVSHYLSRRPEGQRPIVVSFNPWWFSGQEHLARAFFDQLRAVLHGTLKRGGVKLQEKLAEFSESISGVAELVGPVPGVGELAKGAVNLMAPKPKNIHALKTDIAKLLTRSKKRVVVLVDDIDRLAPDEVRQLFTVIKALADFPNVIYLLAFERKVVADSITKETGLDGERFLEKIVQVPFEIPHVDSTTLHEALYKRLDEIVVQQTPPDLFGASYWWHVFHVGIAPLIKVQRDVVRFANTLAVTYPQVAGEVNPTDFVAIEALRVFLPAVYDVVRHNPNQFCNSGTKLPQNRADTRKEFHDEWRESIPKDRRVIAEALLGAIFPMFEQRVSTASEGDLTKERRACVSELFPTYFRLSLPSGVVSRSEIMNILAMGNDQRGLTDALVESAGERRPDGLPKSRAVIEQLIPYAERDIPEANIPNFVRALLDCGDRLVMPSDAEHTSLELGISEVERFVLLLLSRVAEANRTAVLSDAVLAGAAIGLQVRLLRTFEESTQPNARAAGAQTLIDAGGLASLKALVAQKIKGLWADGVLAHPRPRWLLDAWKRWGDSAEVRERCADATASDQGLLAFLGLFLDHVRRQDIDGKRLEPRVAVNVLSGCIDLDATERRLRAMQEEGKVPEDAQVAVSQFFRERELVRQGGDPDDPFAFDDD